MNLVEVGFVLLQTFQAVGNGVFLLMPLVRKHYKDCGRKYEYNRRVPRQAVQRRSSKPSLQAAMESSRMSSIKSRGL